MFFFKSKENYEAKTSVMADLFTLTCTPPPHSEQATHSTEFKFLVPDRGDKVDFSIGLWLVVTATISKRRRDKASILTSFSILKRNEPAYSRTCKDQSEANPAYSTP
jgi:hypothetical protein